MTYRLEFLPSALKEWRKLGATLQQQFTNKLKERLSNPRVPASALRGMPDHYKIKLKQAGYGLVYLVDDGVLTIVVVAVGKCEGSQVYVSAKDR